MALKETEVTETSSGWESGHFYRLTRATFKRHTPPSSRLCVAWLDAQSTVYISTTPRMASCHEFRAGTYPISVDVWSYHKPDDENRISLWSVCWL